MKTSTSARVDIIGVATRDPLIKYAESGTCMAFFTLATNDRAKVEGEWKDVKIYWGITAFGKQAEKLGEQAMKGSLISVSGVPEHTLDGNPPMKEYNGKTNPQYRVTAQQAKVVANFKESEPAPQSETTSGDEQGEFKW